MRALESISRWPGSHAAAVITVDAGVAGLHECVGDVDRLFPMASVTKVVSSLAVLVACEGDYSLLDASAGPPSATVAHLLSHASGLPLASTTPIAAPGVRRIYSNTGIELAVAHAAASVQSAPGELVATRVLQPLGMGATEIVGSVASDATSSTRDLAALACELLVPRLLDAEGARRHRAVAFPGIAGVLPGFGRHDPCDWGLGVEVKGSKSRHWTGVRWPPSTFGHFGQHGGFIAVDEDAGVALVTLGDEPFGPWAVEAWPVFTDEVLDEL